jgi:hypothetical protein
MVRSTFRDKPPIEVWLFGVALLFAVIALISVFLRLPVGTDHADEALYVAMPYRFFLGDRPFIDEYWYSQLPGLFLEPFVHLFVRWTGGTDGIILFFRELFFLFWLMVATIFTAVFWQHLPRWAAVFIGLAAFSFVPFNIFNLGYNELGMGFLQTGALVLFTIRTNGFTPTKLGIAGVLFGLALVSYPTLLGAVLIFTLFLCPFQILKSPRMAVFVAGGVLAGGWVLVLAAQIPFDHWGKVLAYIQSSAAVGGGWQKFGVIFTAIAAGFPHQALTTALILAVFGLIFTKKHAWARLPLFFLPITLTPTLLFYDLHASLEYVRGLALMGWVPFLLIHQNPKARAIFFRLWIPGLFAGFMTAWSSNNGATNFAIGGFIAFIAALILFYLSLTPPEDDKTIQKAPYLARTPGFLVLAFVTGLFLQLQWTAAYGEISLKNPRQTITFGPLRGTETSLEKKTFYESLTHDVRHLPPRESILFYDNFILGFLMTDMKPMIHSMWFPNKLDVPTVDRNSILTYFKDRGTLPSYLVKIKTIQYSQNYAHHIQYPPDDPLIRLATDAGYQTVLETDAYAIYSLPLKPSPE